MFAALMTIVLSNKLLACTRTLEYLKQQHSSRTRALERLRSNSNNNVNSRAEAARDAALLANTPSLKLTRHAPSYMNRSSSLVSTSPVCNLKLLCGRISK